MSRETFDIAAVARYRREMASPLETYRQRFRSAPIGVWSQAVGTFAAMMDQVWTLSPDHTGTIDFHSVMSGRRRLRFEWREVADYHIQVRGLEWDDEAADDSEPEEPDPWFDLRYEFSEGPAGEFAGPFVRLHEVGRDGFWWSDSPLMLSESPLSPASPR